MLKNNLEEQKNDVQEMAELLENMSKEDRKKLKYVIMGMQIMKGAEKAGQEGNRMNFDDVGRFIVIITVISNYVITASQIIKIKE